jgi:hypothetical protein
VLAVDPAVEFVNREGKASASVGEIMRGQRLGMLLYRLAETTDWRDYLLPGVMQYVEHALAEVSFDDSARRIDAVLAQEAVPKSVFRPNLRRTGEDVARVFQGMRDGLCEECLGF